MVQELIRPIVKVGNSAGVLLPREWLNGKARVELISKPLNIKKEVLEILEPYLEDVLGIYLVGSYARGEEKEESDIDVLVISKNTAKTIIKGKHKIIIAPLNAILSTLKEYPERIYPKFMDAKVIINKGLLEEIKKIKLNKDSFKKYIKDSRESIIISRKVLNRAEEKREILELNRVVYSSILRLRAFYMIFCILYKQNYTNKEFERWLIKKIGLNKEEYEKIYAIYMDVAHDKKSKLKISVLETEKLLDFLEKEINNYGKKKKEAAKRNLRKIKKEK